MWRLAEQGVAEAPLGSAPRLYVESLNTTFEAQNVRVAGLRNRIATTVPALELFGAAVAMAVVASHLAVVGLGVLAAGLAAVLVSLMLLVIFDLDRPTRGSCGFRRRFLPESRHRLRHRPRPIDEE